MVIISRALNFVLKVSWFHLFSVSFYWRKLLLSPNFPAIDVTQRRNPQSAHETICIVILYVMTTMKCKVLTQWPRSMFTWHRKLPRNANTYHLYSRISSPRTWRRQCAPLSVAITVADEKAQIRKLDYFLHGSEGNLNGRRGKVCFWTRKECFWRDANVWRHGELSRVRNGDEEGASGFICSVIVVS